MSNNKQNEPAKKSANQPRPAGRPPGRVLDPNAHGLAAPPAHPTSGLDRCRALLKLSRDVPRHQVEVEAADEIERLRRAASRP